MAKQTAGDAVLAILKAYRYCGTSQRVNAAHYKRVRKACDRLGLSSQECESVMQYFDYHDPSGQPWGWLVRALGAAS